MRLATGLPEYPAVFSDGGLIGKNPSPIGGTWAWVRVEVGATGFEAAGEAGVVSGEYGLLLPSKPAKLASRPPDDLVIRIWRGETIESNQCETMGLARALDALPDGWSGRVCADNLTALRRAFDGASVTNVPPEVVERLRAAVERLGTIEWVLLMGHPTSADLARGYGERALKSGEVKRYPVSKWNAYVDAECWRARADAARMGLGADIQPVGQIAKEAQRRHAFANGSRDDTVQTQPGEISESSVGAVPAAGMMPRYKGTRWARRGVARGAFCHVAAHESGEHDYGDPCTHKNICGVCLPLAALQKAGGLEECQPPYVAPYCSGCKSRHESSGRATKRTRVRG